MSSYYSIHKKQLVLFGILFIVAILLATVVFLKQRQQIVQYAAGDTVTVIAASDFQATGNLMLKTTSDLALKQNADYVLAIGDISDSGTLSSYQSSYAPTWGRMMSITYPAPGNHDKYPGNINQYLQYFSSRYDSSQTYYSVNWGAWHIISLDSNNPSSSTQLAWLKKDLAANSNKPILAFWHIPRWSTDNTHGNTSSIKALWDPLYEAHADVIVNGHVHVYQRYAPMDGSGNLKSDGIREFTAGIAGNKTRSCPKNDSHLEYRSCGSSGFMKFTLTPTNYSWEYIKSDGSIVDSGSASVHAAAAATETVTPPTSTPVPGQSTQFSLKVLLHGLGNAGDNANPNSSGNFDIQHPQRTVTLEFYDTNNQLAATKQGTITLNPQSGAFTGIIDGSSIQAGSYRIRVAVDKYLAKYIDGIQTITEGTNNVFPEISLIAGDVTNDNLINIVDYNSIIDCFSDILPANVCDQTRIQKNDINDDGKVNQFDYNLFLRELTNLSGDPGLTITFAPKITNVPTSTPPPSSSNSKLTWAPPALNNPTTINVTEANHRSIKLDSSKDYIVKFPDTPLTTPYRVDINGGRNVVIIGGKIVRDQDGAPSDTYYATGLKLYNWTGTMHVEGLEITGAALNDGILIDTRQSGAKLQIENVRIATVQGSEASHHGDCLQNWGGPAIYLVDRVTCITKYQGMMIQPQHFGGPTDVMDVRNSNFVHLTADGYLFFRAGGVKSLKFTNVYGNPGGTKGGTKVGYPENDSVFNQVIMGDAPSDFAPESTVGLNYTSPGYK